MRLAGARSRTDKFGGLTQSEIILGRSDRLPRVYRTIRYRNVHSAVVVSCKDSLCQALVQMGESGDVEP